jgi:hypothetical protein
MDREREATFVKDGQLDMRPVNLLDKNLCTSAHVVINTISGGEVLCWREKRSY